MKNKYAVNKDILPDVLLDEMCAAFVHAGTLRDPDGTYQARSKKGWNHRGKAWPRGSDATTPNGGDGVEAEGLMVKG